MRSGDNLLESTEPGAEKDELAKKLDDTKQRWEDVKAKAKDHSDRVNTAVPEAAKYKEAVESLSPWLAEAEEKVASLETILTDEDALKEREVLVNGLREEIEDHKPERDMADNKSKAVVDVTDTDKDDVLSEAKDITDRYDRLNAKCADKEHELQDVKDALQAYRDALQPVQELLDKAENKIGDEEPISGDLDKNKDELEKIKVRSAAFLVSFFALLTLYS